MNNLDRTVLDWIKKKHLAWAQGAHDAGMMGFDDWIEKVWQKDPPFVLIVGGDNVRPN